MFVCLFMFGCFGELFIIMTYRFESQELQIDSIRVKMDSGDDPFEKIMDKLFVYVENKDLNLNRIRSLVVNPEIIRVLIQQIVPLSKDKKIQCLQKLSTIYMKNSLNPAILYKRDRQILQFNHSIFDEIISSIMCIKQDLSENKKLMESMRPLLQGYPVGCRNIKNVIKEIAKDFHYQKFNSQKLQLSLQILSEFYKNQVINLSEPKCYFFVYGPNSGVRMVNNQVKWTLFKGFYFYISFYIEGEEHEELGLLNITINDDSFELAINEANELKVKVFSASKEFKFRKLESKRWYFLKLAYCLKTGIMRNSFQLIAHIDGEPYELRDLPIPSPTMKDSIEQLIIGYEFYGKINVAALSREEIKYWPKSGVNNWSQVEGLLLANKNHLKNIFLLYSPLIITQFKGNEFVYQITSRNHAEILENTAIFNNQFDEVNINYYGGLYTVMPFFHILRFYKFENYPVALQDSCNLLVSLFQLGFQGIETQAVNCQLFSILAQFFNQMNQRYITPEVIDCISSFKETIESKNLRKQFFLNFLWKINIDRIKNLKTIERIHRTISWFYYKNFEEAIELKPICEIIWYILDNFQPDSPQNCCLLHSWELNSDFDEESLLKVEEQYKEKGKEIMVLIKFIMKTLCANGRHQKIFGPTRREQMRDSFDEKSPGSENILEFLIQNHSICFKKMIIECLLVGIEQNPLICMKESEILNCMFFLLPKAELKDELSPIIRILSECIKAYEKIRNQKAASEIIDHIEHQLNNIYMKQYSAIRVRSKSEGLLEKKKSTERKLSVCVEEGKKMGHEFARQEEQKIVKSRVIKLKKERKIRISNDSELFDVIMKICCVRDEENGEFLLIDDEYTKIIGSYFKICCSRFRVKLIETVKNTVLFKSKAENFPPKMDSLHKFDRIYGFILSEFILKELDPDDPEYQPSENSNYIMRNLFFIVDHIVVSLKNDWDALYQYLIRLIGLLRVEASEIKKKTSRDIEEIYMAKKICIRKFVLRVLKHAQKNIQNMSNMIFLVYLVVFSNEERQNLAHRSSRKTQIELSHRQSREKMKKSKSEGLFLTEKPKLFKYFRVLEENFLLIPFQLIDADKHIEVNKNLFMDEKIIFESLDVLHLGEILRITEDEDESKSRKMSLNFIKAFFQKNSNKIQEQLIGIRKIFLSCSKFREINQEENKTIRSMFSSFISEPVEEINETHEKIDRPLYVCELIGLLISLCIEESVQTQRIQSLKESLNKFESFIKIFMLVCSRDWLKKSEHHSRNKDLPKNITYHLIHFLYKMAEQTYDACHNEKEEQLYRGIIEQKILSIINFLTLLMTVLSEKVGHPQTLEDTILLSAVMQDVEEYNYFSFEVLKGVITLGEIRMFSTLGLKKKYDVVNHPNMKEHFKNCPKVFLERHMREVIETHNVNIEKVSKELEYKFTENKSALSLRVDSTIFHSPEVFEEHSLRHARKLNFEYRQTMRVWRKIWKRLRLYHYYWAVAMDQREDMNLEWNKFTTPPYKHKLSKYTDLQGLRPVLEVQPNEPWHVRKAQLDQEVSYRAKNFMVNLYKPKSHTKLEPKSFIGKLFKKVSFSSSYHVDWIKHNSKRKGLLYLTKEKLVFEYRSTFQKDSHVDFTSFTLAEHRPTQKSWPLATIKNIIKRRYLMREQCLLIEFEDDTGITFNFLDENSEQFLSKIEELQLQKSEMLNFMKANKIKFYSERFRKKTYSDVIEKYTSLWQTRKITNLHYLMVLNKYSGRSSLDPVNYPVLPWVIKSYDCKQIIYRDLSKTLGALGSESRKDFYMNKIDSLDAFSQVPPYQYGTHYSSPGVVFNFLIRLSPYTEAARTLQGGKFDLSDRLFSSIPLCWHSVTSQVSDVRELLPEFYYLPEFLINLENYDFGKTQLKERIHNVRLPIWGQTPYSFITTHRRAFESEQVSSSISQWIDLIFGYKQKGKAAEEAVNLYYYLTYENSIDLHSITDPVERTSIEAQIIHFGQTPTQIFYKPHPKRLDEQKAVENEPIKIKLVGSIESVSPLVLLESPESGTLVFMRDFNLVTVSISEAMQIKCEVDLHRQASKENLYHIEDISSMKKVQMLGGRFVVVGSYVNGDLVIYSMNSGKKVFQRKGVPKCLVYVNKAQNLIFCGCKNGLLEVYEVVYSEKQHVVTLLKISEDYLMFNVEQISEGGGFYCISAGNLVIINKVTRGLSYIHDKMKMKGMVMLRSFQSKRKVNGSFICTNPLYCVLFYNSLEVWVYSINGQFLKIRQIESLVNPVILTDSQHRQNLLVLQHSGLTMLQLPELQSVSSIAVPQKEYLEMKVLQEKTLLITTKGEILTTSHFHQSFNMF